MQDVYEAMVLVRVDQICVLVNVIKADYFGFVTFCCLGFNHAAQCVQAPEHVHAVVIATVCALLPLSHCGLCQNNIF